MKILSQKPPALRKLVPAEVKGQTRWSPDRYVELSLDDPATQVEVLEEAWDRGVVMDEVEMEPLAFSILAEGYRLRKLSPPRTSALIRAAPRSRRWSIAWALDNRVGSNVAINR